MARKSGAGQSRRDFMRAGGAMGAAALLAPTPLRAGTTQLPALPSNPATAAAMPTRNLGRTGFRVGILGLGGQATVERRESEAVKIVERALDLGVNYLDTASIYGGPDRMSERNIGQAIAGRRAQAFLASKTKERSRDASLRMLEQSLELLGADQIDLWQLHDIGTLHDIEEVFAKGGAVEALIQAREQKMVRFLGLTGHFHPDALVEGIRRFPFDVVLMAVNAADVHHHSFVDKLLPLALEKQMGIVAMKITSRSRLLSSWTPPAAEQQRRNTWESADGKVIANGPGTIDMREALGYSLSLPVSTAIIGCDSVAQLEENVRLARDFTPFSREQMAAIEARTAPVARQALFFRFHDRA